MFRATIKSKSLPDLTGMEDGKVKNMKIGNHNNTSDRLFESLKQNITDLDVTWCGDGCMVISGKCGKVKFESMLDEFDFEITIDNPEIKHKGREVNGISCHDIDEIYEPETPTEKKKIKIKKITNTFKEAENAII